MMWPLVDFLYRLIREQALSYVVNTATIELLSPWRIKQYNRVYLNIQIA